MSIYTMHVTAAVGPKHNPEAALLARNGTRVRAPPPPPSQSILDDRGTQPMSCSIGHAHPKSARARERSERACVCLFLVSPAPKATIPWLLEHLPKGPFMPPIVRPNDDSNLPSKVSHTRFFFFLRLHFISMVNDCMRRSSKSSAEIYARVRVYRSRAYSPTSWVRKRFPIIGAVPTALHTSCLTPGYFSAGGLTRHRVYCEITLDPSAFLFS
ncbi:hypothetical protein BKA66DRAFT_209315 [Pyrenochaeta sp. MPI-SDFR-AT-0127]|nr:hypothetical protein BKA66DRAFT_209315 [Pyrenochaeta sp. MPI-SDFR-AT-0127]